MRSAYELSWGSACPWLRGFFLLGVCVLLFVSAAGCGEGGGTQAISFVYSDSSMVGFVTWTQNSDGMFSGQWTTLTLASGKSDPTPFAAGITGRVDQQQNVLLSVSGQTLTGTLSQKNLRLATVGPSGQSTTQVWLAGSSADYHLLAQAFTVYAHLNSALAMLSATEQNPPDDSSAATYDDIVQFKARDYVNALQQEFTQIRQSSDPCQSIARAEFHQAYPSSAGTFALTPYPTAQDAAAHTQLSQTLSTIQADWKSAQAAMLPTIDALSAPWVTSTTDEEASVLLGQQTLAALQRAIEKEYAAMSLLQSQARSMADQVHQIEQQHGC